MCLKTIFYFELNSVENGLLKLDQDILKTINLIRQEDEYVMYYRLICVRRVETVTGEARGHL